MPAPALPNAEDDAARSSRGRATAIIAAGVAAYVVALVATLPARIVAPHGSDATGTVWHGVMTRADGATVTWDWSPARSLESGSVAVAWILDATDTHLTGVARLRPFTAPELSRVEGRAAWALLAAAVPGLPQCTIPMIVALETVAVRGATGAVRSLPGTCPGAVPGTTRAVARMIATFNGAQGRVAPWTEPATSLAIVDMAGGTIRLHVTAAGAAVFGRAGDIEFAP